MSSLLRTSVETWKSSQNPVIVAYRDSLDGCAPPSKLFLVKSAATNALKAVGRSFASIPELIRSNPQQVSNWTQAKIYWELTLISLKAIWNFTQTLESLLKLEAQICLDQLFLTNALPPPLQAHIDCKNPQDRFPLRNLESRLKIIMDTMSPKDHESILAPLALKFPDADQSIQLSAFRIVFALAESGKMDHSESRLRTLCHHLTNQHQVPLIRGKDVSFVSTELVNALGNGVFPPHATWGKLGIVTLTPGTDQDFIEKVNRVVNNHATRNNLFWDITLLEQLLDSNDATVKAFLNEACSAWANAILTASPKANDISIINRLIKITNKHQHQDLVHAVQVRELSVIDMTKMKPEWINWLGNHMQQLVPMIFGDSIKLSKLIAFVRLLCVPFLIKKENSIFQLFRIAEPFVNQFSAVTPEQLKTLKEEFTTSFNTTDIRNLDFYIELHTELAKTGLRPLLEPVLKKLGQILKDTSIELKGTSDVDTLRKALTVLRIAKEVQVSDPATYDAITQYLKAKPEVGVIAKANTPHKESEQDHKDLLALYA